MSATLHIFKTALDDLQNALDWYKSQSDGLESRFSKAVNERLTFIADYPEASSIRVYLKLRVQPPNRIRFG